MVDCEGVKAGLVIGESSPSVSTAIMEPGVQEAHAGAFVVSRSEEGCVLGMIESMTAGTHWLPSDPSSPDVVEEILRDMGPGVTHYLRAQIRWVSIVEAEGSRVRMRPPRRPVMPGSPVYVAPPEILGPIFSPEGVQWLRLGRLLQGEVEYRVNANMLLRHLAILAVTGGGKSNTVCVLTRRLVRGLNATMVIFDMHGEYGDLGLGGKAVVHKPAGMNPLAMSFHELLELVRMPPRAINQERILRWAWKSARMLYSHGRIRSHEVMPTVRRLLEELLAANANASNSMYIRGLLKDEVIDKPPLAVEKDQVQGVLNKLDDLDEYYSDVLNPRIDISLESVIQPGKLTVFDLSELDENGADAVASHYLRRILQERKRYKATGGATGYPVPLLVIVEEAHVLLPREGERLSKYWAARIAREGRKFGVGLVLVSQRPKNVDPDILSQTNNKIILRMVEPQDIRYVQQASEELSDDLTSLLPGLSPGEAVVIGSMTRMPALVKIDKCDVETGGSDINLVEEWNRVREPEDLARELF